MGNIYIAVNGDDVGTTIGQHIAADDHENLQSTSQAVKGAHQMISDWVEQQGGQEVTSSGDEGVYVVPEESLGELEEIRSQYADSSGHSLTVGIGSSMSEASKALIYGKLSGKDQIVEYDSSMDSQLSGEEEEDYEEEDSKIPMDDKTPEEDNLEEPAPELDEDDLGEEEMEAAPEGTDGIPSESDDEIDEDVGEIEDQGEIEADGDTSPPEEEIESEESVYDDLTETDGDNPEEEMDAPEEEMEAAPGEEMEGDGEESYDYNDSLTDMIQSHMDGEDEMEGAPEEEMEGAPEDGEDDDLKSDIANALMAFKENKDMLEAAREQNPALYEATITMLRSMIDMAKKLGYSPEQDIESAEAEEEMVENFPDAEEDMGAAPEESEEEIEPEEDLGSDEEEVTEKKPKGKDQ